jgi:hypothetical protein
MKTRRRRRNPQDAYHRRNLILPEELVSDLDSWHGGQSSATYSLASTGRNHYVSQAMIESAADELSRIKRSRTGVRSYRYSASEWKNLQDTIEYLHVILRSPREFSTKEHGLGDEDAGYSK